MSGMQGANGQPGQANASTDSTDTTKKLKKIGDKPDNVSRDMLMKALQKTQVQSQQPQDSGYSP